MKSKFIIQYTLILILNGFLNLQAQTLPYNGNADVSFETARQLAFNKQRKQAQDTLMAVLSKYPDYHDVRSFLASTYAWDTDYKKARKEFAVVIEKAPENKENWIAAIKNEIWSGANYEALQLCQTALHRFPDNAEIILLKATAVKNTANPIEAQKIIQELLLQNPENPEAKQFLNEINSSLRTNAIGVKSAVEFYSEAFDPMQYHTLNYSKQTQYGKIIGRLNFNRRFNENGAQAEIDLYPKISKSLYAYLNVGFSNSFLFPDLRYGAELYKTLPHRLELSAGFRTLKYNNTTTVYTGSLGWYTGKNYWSLRPYFTPTDGVTSFSAAINYKKYRQNSDNYISLLFNAGTFPEANQFLFTSNTNAIVNLKTQRFQGGYFFSTANNKNALGAQLEVAHQEISFNPGNYFWIYSLTLSWDLRFK